MTTADLREDALACFREAVDAVEPSRLVAESLRRHLLESESLTLAAVGKAAAAMTRGALEALPGRIRRGVLIVPEKTAADALSGPPLTVFHGGHPVPNEEGRHGASTILQWAESLGRDDVLLCLISGGGSSLMTLPVEGCSLEDLSETTDQLLRAGATIGELNCVRKHLDQLKGGRLARAASPARVLALVLSDVVGDPLDVIASGPVVPDPTTFADALGVLERRGVMGSVPAAVRGYLERGVRGEEEESPKEGHPSFERVEARIVGHNRLAADAALAEARRRGYRTMLLSTVVTGEAREVGRMLAAVGREIRGSSRPLAAPACVVAAGETTVTVRGRGRGGRNQEVALGAALALDGAPDGDGVLVASLGTDGVDGPTDAAGAVATGDTIARARALGLDPERALDENDTHPFFEALGDLVKTGPTGTNVMDLMFVWVSQIPRLSPVGSRESPPAPPFQGGGPDASLRFGLPTSS